MLLLNSTPQYILLSFLVLLSQLFFHLSDITITSLSLHCYFTVTSLLRLPKTSVYSISSILLSSLPFHALSTISSSFSFFLNLHTQHTPYPPPQGPAGMPLRSTQSLLGIQLPTSPEGAAQLLGPMGTSAKMGRTARRRERDRKVSITLYLLVYTAF